VSAPGKTHWDSLSGSHEKRATAKTTATSVVSQPLPLLPFLPSAASADQFSAVKPRRIESMSEAAPRKTGFFQMAALAERRGTLKRLARILPSGMRTAAAEPAGERMNTPSTRAWPPRELEAGKLPSRP